MRPEHATRHTSRPATWTCTWHAGPDAGARHRLSVGRHLVGRGTSVGADDPALEPHHVALDVTPDGTLTLTPLTGRTPLAPNGRTVTRGSSITIADGDWVEVGDSLVRCTLGEPEQLPLAHLRDGALVRTPRLASTWSAPELDDPVHAGSSTGVGTGGTLTPALLALAGAGAMAMVLGQPMFFMFGLIGALVAVGTWIAQRIAVRRARRRDRETLERAADAFAAHHHASVQTLERARHIAARRDAALWSRRASHHDAFLVSLGLGTVAVPLRALDRRLTDVPVGIDLGPGARFALRGPHARAVARALVAQLVTSCGPADLRLVVTTNSTAGPWSYLDDLPHRLELADCASVAAPTHVVHLTDRPDALALRTSPLRRALVDTARHALLVVLDDDLHDAVPHLCTHVCTTTDGPWGWWSPVGHTEHTLPVRITGLGARAALAHATVLRDLRDPEDPFAADDDLPAQVLLTDLLGQLHGGSVTAAWALHAQQPDAGPNTPIGMAHDGVVDLDLVRDGPHALIAGTTGSGKSELLRSMVLGMSTQASPHHINFVLIDYKGGATFDDLAALPHVVGVVTDLEAHLADRVLRSLHAELRRREGVLREHRVADLPALRAAAPQVAMPRLVVVIDEFAALVHEQPDFLHALLGIAQRGRSLGVHLVLATQRPNGVISDDIRANTNLRIALRLHDSVDAVDVVGRPDPAHLPRHRPGRAIVRLGNDEHVAFQTAVCEPGRSIRAIADAAASMNTTYAAPPTPPWLPPLATSLTAAAVPHGAIGLIDDPDRQAVHPLHWSPDDGNVLAVGSIGSGTSTTVDTLARRAAGSDTHHVYRLIDHDAAPIDGVVTVSVHDRELMARLLHRMEHRTFDDPPVVLVIDTLDGARRALDDPGCIGELDTLDALLQRPDPRLVIVVAALRPAAVPAAFLARCAHRWVHHLHDPHDATHLGMRPTEVPPAIPGRIHLVSSGLAAQVAPLHSSPRLVHPTRLAPPVPLSTVPSLIDPHDLHPINSALGVSLHTGATIALDLHPGEHLTVLGSARSGRTTALLRLTTAWSTLHPTGTITVLGPRQTCDGRSRALLDLADRDLLVADPPEGPHLLVVDDAELVDDADGALAALASTRDARTTIVIAGRPDALRQMYGHWTSIVRRSRNGLVAARNNDLDGDLLGAMLPRHTPVAPRPGLMWWVVDGHVELVQVAADNLVECASRLAPR